MSRTRIELESKDNERLSHIIDNILTSRGYEYSLYKGSSEQVWNQGIGLLKAPKYIKYYFENNKVILEGWVGTYGKESDLNGVVGALPKNDVKKILNEIEKSVNDFNQNPALFQDNSVQSVTHNSDSKIKANNIDTPANNNITGYDNTGNTTTSNQATKMPSGQNVSKKIIYDVISIIISLIIMMGALSGTLVFRGTNSSGLLALFILMFLIYEVYSLIKHLKEKKAIENHIEKSVQKDFQPQASDIKSNIDENNIDRTRDAFNLLKEDENNGSAVNNPPINTNNVPSNNNVISGNSSNANQKVAENRKKVLIVVGIILIIAIIGGLAFSANSNTSSIDDSSSDSYYSDSDEYYSDDDSSDTSSSLIILITDVSESEDTGSDSNWKYTYNVYGEISGSSTIPGGTFVHVSYYDANGNILDFDDVYELSTDSEILIDDYFSDTKVDHVTVELRDSSDFLIDQDTYYC